MVAGANKYHATDADARRPATARTLEAGPVLPAPVRMAAMVFLGIMLAGLLLETVADALDISDAGDDQWDHFAAATLLLYGRFLFGAALLWGASVGTSLSTGVRVGLLVMGALVTIGAAASDAWLGFAFNGLPFRF